jgi:hypothetical protein
MLMVSGIALGYHGFGSKLPAFPLFFQKKDFFGNLQDVLVGKGILFFVEVRSRLDEEFPFRVLALPRHLFFGGIVGKSSVDIEDSDEIRNDFFRLNFQFSTETLDLVF